MSKYSQFMLSEAYSDVKERGLPIRKAARLHNVPESTLRLRLAHSQGLAVKRGGPTIFTRQQEEYLAQYCVSMAHLGYGFTRWQVLDMASSMCEITGKNLQPTKHWFYGFLERFPDVQMMNHKKREKSRDEAVNQDVLNNYFNELNVVMDKYNIKNKPEHIWNVDETGISLDHSPPKILARTGTSPYIVTAGRSANTTLIAAGSALGETLPPYIIFKGQRLTNEMTAEGMKGSEYRVTPTGWSNSTTFLDFFQNHFLRHVTVRPCLLLYDGHSTHITMDVIEAARKENIHLFVLPPHSSHCLQPFDVSVFSAFKKSLNSEFHKYMHSHPHSVVTVDILPNLISNAYKSALIVSNLMAGFRKTGIFPFNPSAPVVIPPTINKSEQILPITRKARTENRQVKILFQDKSEAFEKLKQGNKQKKRKSFVPPFGAAITEETFYEEAKIRQEDKASKVQNKDKASKVQNKRTHIFTPPFIDDASRSQSDKVKQAKKRPRTVAPAVSSKKQTDTFCKKGKGPHPNSKKGKNPAKKKKVTTYSQDNENCIVCGKWQPSNLHLDRGIKFVSWGQCTRCEKWVHLKFCTDVQQLDDDDEFTCPICSSEQ